MADRSSIEWTEATWNPTTGCDRVTAGCDHCYALTLAKRLKAMGASKYQNDGNPRTSGAGFKLTLHEESLKIPYKWRSPRTVFVNSMSDLFHARVPRTFIHEVFEVMENTPQHTYQILTKRARRLRLVSKELTWPENVWMGVSVENLSTVHRIADLRASGAVTKFLSCEPLLGPLPDINLEGIDWVIGGGESGPNFREMKSAWICDLRDACLESQVPFFFKQWGGQTPKAGGRLLDGRTWDEMPHVKSSPVV
ncbi:phage Gp37/Gp68 family protein [Spirillospora sp. NPDC049652]